MKSENAKTIQEAFTLQSENFETSKMNFSKKDYLDYVAASAEPKQSDSVLEVAAGTCACGRTLAPFVQNVTCLDMTPAMLTVGRKEAEKQGVSNMTYVIGDAQELPFIDNSFDIVISRLAFHHFPEVQQPFSEMVRVLKPNGKLIMIEMEASEETLRQVRDEIETMRDPSHVRNLSKAEMLKLFADHSLSIEKCETTNMPALLNNWMELTKTPAPVREEITKRFQDDLSGKEKTGFDPYQTEKGISFSHKWVLVIGRKALQDS